MEPRARISDLPKETPSETPPITASINGQVLGPIEQEVHNVFRTALLPTWIAYMKSLTANLNAPGVPSIFVQDAQFESTPFSTAGVFTAATQPGSRAVFS